ncbi:hypothetical protein [Jannaschia formosa]|uniref:hypothetical protein n=1 Tax=Jannaschia formosa TaxID=2259592 RepID=UPI001075317B|nr:hypothetical protein [Jannaschia formosa]TFL16018.1 hypothetical protein DR046_22255 [Jannaschia formosa]
MTIEVPPPLDGGETPDWADDSKAKAETKYWGNDKKLKDAKTWADAAWARSYGFVVIILLVVFSVLFAGSLLAWSLHYLLPESWHWLSDEQLSKIQSVLFSGSLGGVLSFVAQKQISK